MMSIKDELIRTIDIRINKIINKIASIKNRDVVAVVKEINGDKYRVDIDGYNYWMKDGVGIALSVGSSVWVRIPEGKMSLAYICAKR